MGIHHCLVFFDIIIDCSLKVVVIQSLYYSRLANKRTPWKNCPKWINLLVLGPSRSSAWLSFGSSFWAKKLGSARLAMPSKKLGSARHILQKKLGSARLALSYKKPSYLEKQKLSEFPTFLPIFWGKILRASIKVCFFC